MLAMIGTLHLDDSAVVDALTRRLHHYQTVRVSDSQRVVLIPPIGSFLVDWDSTSVRLHIAANNQRDLDELMCALNDELHRGPGVAVNIDWVVASSVPVPFR